MKIIIDYESSWRNSFLDGDNNEPLPKNGRKFIGSMTNLKNSKNFIPRDITIDTVMGVLNRLIGDQRKLYQSREQDGYFFAEIENENLVDFKDKPKVINNEMTYIRNISGSTDQNSYTGAIKADDTMFTSEYSKEYWGVLALDCNELYEFLLNEEYLVNKDISLNPIDLADKMELLNKLKPIDNTDLITKVVRKLNTSFSDLITEKQPHPYIENNGKVKPIRLYSAGLYVQLNRLSSKFDMGSAVTKSGKVAGFSKRGFNGRRDFIKNFVTGGEKKIFGNPYAIKEFKSLKPMMTKASGALEINIKVARDKAKQIKKMIDNAGVSSFYLGKKGLAYVSKISTREED